ncbi:MAG TPA: TolC family protein [Acidobacteriaceae bacterium]
MHRGYRVAAILALTLSATLCATAQISLTSAVDLALKSNPRVRLAEADVNKAAAGLAQAKDVYIPALTVGSGLGFSYGYPLGQPSVVNVTMQSVLVSFSQPDYIRAARAAMQAASFTLNDARAGVEQDTVVTYLALNRDLAREQALSDEFAHAQQLVNIVADRLNAGVDTGLDLTQAKLTAAQTHLALLNVQDETATDQSKLAHLVGLPAERLATVAASVPHLTAPDAAPALTLPESPAVRAAFANAQSKQEIAWGDERKLYKPEIYFASQYSLFAKFNNYQIYFPAGTFQYNNAGIGVQVSWPIFDRARKAHAQESAADAVHAFAEAQIARDKEQEGNTQLTRSTVELSAKADVAQLQQELAQQQLDAINLQLQPNAATTAGQQRTPKDQANAEIDQSARLVDLLNARFDLEQAQIQLLRQQGRLDDWLRAAAATTPATNNPTP